MMLPDFPSLKKDVERLLELAARAQVSLVSGVAGPLPRLGVYEGDRHVLVRENGEVAEGAYETVSAEESLEPAEVETLSLEQAFEMYIGMMCEIGAREDGAFVELANREAESRGQVVEGAGRPLPEVILEAVERWR